MDVGGRERGGGMRRGRKGRGRKGGERGGSGYRIVAFHSLSVGIDGTETRWAKILLFALVRG